jgi:uncharacterized protein YneF (UPF0154 family)
VPPVEHIIYIPVVLILGIVIGYVLGGRAAREDLEKKRKRARE